MQLNEQRQRKDREGPSPALVTQNPRRYSSLAGRVFNTGSYTSQARAKSRLRTELDSVMLESRCRNNVGAYAVSSGEAKAHPDYSALFE
ncbi:hypothetical protein [Burkholderia metallica]|uniref:hypothetical protein n=1 Tax=Burkholderia metallica TaxID=488729 RepID=UPI00131DD880|nr:hypothetical protein [Burkholderia metallica]